MEHFEIFVDEGPATGRIKDDNGRPLKFHSLEAALEAAPLITDGEWIVYRVTSEGDTAIARGRGRSSCREA